jgi:tRNA threonylcarbamoyladenosine biosynthesis protein TsaE
MKLVQITHSVEETRNAGARCAAAAREGDTYALEGELGCGKTEFVRGFVGYLGCGYEVRSPTFSIVNIYETDTYTVYHFDFYRLTASSELDEIGFDEYLTGGGICLIEWGTMFPEKLPPNTRIIKFTDEGERTRRIEINGREPDTERRNCL